MNTTQLARLMESPEYRYIKNLYSGGGIAIEWKRIPKRIQCIVLRNHATPLIKFAGTTQFYEPLFECFHMPRNGATVIFRPGTPVDATHCVNGLFYKKAQKSSMKVPSIMRYSMTDGWKPVGMFSEYTDGMIQGAVMWKQEKKNVRHPHADMMKEWIEDTTKKIQVFQDNRWMDDESPVWDANKLYRFKPTHISSGEFVQRYTELHWSMSDAEAKLLSHYHQWLEDNNALKKRIKL